jgi:hypothetical protein
MSRKKFTTKLIGLSTTLARVFYEFCIQEINAGNTANGIMTNQWYNNIAEKYRLATGLRHSKGLYSFWLQLNKDIGLGWNEALVACWLKVKNRFGSGLLAACIVKKLIHHIW